MTPPVDDPETLRRILANTEALLLDFDGPICSVFAGVPASVVANQLRGVLAEGGYSDLPTDVRTADDPFDVLFYAAKLGHDEARYVEAAFRGHEVEAVQSAVPTSQSAELMHAWKATGRTLAIVSNNSVLAVETYLDIHKLRADVNLVSARAGADVELLKPSPSLILQAAEGLNVVHSRCVLVGDSVTDVQAARAARSMAIGYANKLGKLNQLQGEGASAVITSIRPLVSALAT